MIKWLKIYDDNEDLISEWFKLTGRRYEVFLATKFGIDLKSDDSFSLNGRPEGLNMFMLVVGVRFFCRSRSRVQLATVRELGVAILAYSPLGRGLLTGAIKSPDQFEATDVGRYMPRFCPENFGKNLELVEKFKVIADRKGFITSPLTLA
ncbi:NADP-dependent oxidoreductase domain-containing protein [Mycena galericulata]|nr:NADP-dependent oxidoreductase domain-containing protein [Mycena galericulata]